ncbi:endonuclease [Lampropedia puyangensis]|uniref:Endonuclease n=1 Tax=Lampropedia puyangensis TaxID=1330072 RepID=A0A4S8FFY7_9BURK|nr:endonuclease/exonuclease/phosphatase family protein [Lampropedia puyangensis]THU05414.1 endonuclease [Lampropedia puyangensis]
MHSSASLLPAIDQPHLTDAQAPERLRVATYNIHKGVQGLGPLSRLEIGNLGLAVEQLDADIICLQEVRKANLKEQERFANWPEIPQAQFLAPEGYEAVYYTNAITRYGEHGNALLSRWPVLGSQQRDISDHRLEQRGILHARIDVSGHCVHVLVVHLGLIHISRLRQVALIREFIQDEIPADEAVVIAGDFNDWGDQTGLLLRETGFSEYAQRAFTYPSILPVVQLDRIFVRHLTPASVFVPRGRIWRRMSDHLPLVSDFTFSPNHHRIATV